MHRQGILENEIDAAMELITKNPNIILEGLCTHFADADNKNPEFTNEHIEEFKRELNEAGRELHNELYSLLKSDTINQRNSDSIVLKIAELPKMHISAYLQFYLFIVLVSITSFLSYVFIERQLQQVRIKY